MGAIIRKKRIHLSDQWKGESITTITTITTIPNSIGIKIELGQSDKVQMLRSHVFSLC